MPFDGAKKNQVNQSGSLSGIEGLEASLRNKGITAAQIAQIEAAQRGSSILPASGPTGPVGFTPSSLNTSLVSDWKLGEASGTRFDSVVASANDLTDNNTVTSAPGLVGTAALFTRANSESLTVASNANLQSSQDFAISCWINPTTLPAANLGIVSKGTSAAYEWAIYINSSHVPNFEMGEGTTGNGLGAVSSGVTLSTGTWYFIAAWYDFTNNRSFISVNGGAAVQSGALSTKLGVGTGALALGCYQTTIFFYDGLMQYVDYWKRQLTAQDVTNLYNGGTPLAYAP